LYENKARKKQPSGSSAKKRTSEQPICEKQAPQPQGPKTKATKQETRRNGGGGGGGGGTWVSGTVGTSGQKRNER